MVRVTYKDIRFAEELKFDLLVEDCLFVELKCVQCRTFTKHGC
jgi:hypothetical protein